VIRGASPERVRDALDAGTPFFGTSGFAGELPDGRLVRDVLGRETLYVDGDEWDVSPDALADPSPFPAGHVETPTGSERCWSLPEPPVASKSNALDNLETALGDTLSALDDGTPVAFSGGVDSAVVASAVDAPLYVAGFPDSQDREAARDGARRMGREGALREVRIDAGTLEAAVPKVARATGRTNPMDVAIAAPLYVVAERVAADGFERMALGQGVDEAFGGYEKVASAPSDSRVDATTVRGARTELLATLPEQLERDLRAIRGAGVEAVTPLLHDRVVDAALRLPEALLVDARGERKVGFRRAARAFVPDCIAFREKKAVQYGSLVARELDRLAREAGFKRREGNHVQRYVASRL